MHYMDKSIGPNHLIFKCRCFQAQVYKLTRAGWAVPPSSPNQTQPG